MKAAFHFVLALLSLAGVLNLTAADAPQPVAPEELARFEGVWSGKWNVNVDVEFTFKRTADLKFDVLVHEQTNRLYEARATYKGTAEYNHELKGLKSRMVEFFWHEDGQRLVARGTFPNFTSYSILRRQPASKEEKGG